jgi:hypothetical protein
VLLVDVSTWHERPGDDDWRHFIENLLLHKYGNIVAAHVDKMRLAPTTYRIKPTDLIAAAQLPLLASMQEIEPLVPLIQFMLWP